MQNEGSPMSTSPSASSFDGEDALLEQLRTRGAKSESAPARASGRAQRHRMIAEAAYYCAERRGFAPGHELEDWLRAEAEIARSLR
jgi:DUF2934 family protein